MRKVHSKEFKFKVSLEAIKGELTIAQIISKYQVAESLVHKWRKQLLDGGSDVFSGGKEQKQPPSPTEDVEKLQATIGRLKVQNDFLEGALLKFQNKGAVR